MMMRNLIGKEFEMEKEVACYEGAKPVTVKRKVRLVGAESNYYPQSFEYASRGSDEFLYPGHLPRLVFEDEHGTKFHAYFEVCHKYLKLAERGIFREFPAISDSMKLVFIKTR